MVRRIAALGVALLALFGCGPAGTPAAKPSATTDPAFPVTIHGAAGTVRIPARPRRIVSLSPSATEMLYAIGAGPAVVAVDDHSTYPTRAPRTSLSDFHPNAEAIAARHPDLVVLSRDGNGTVAALRRLRVPVLLTPTAASLADTYRQIGQLGTATGRAAAGTAEVARIKRHIATVVRETPRPRTTITVYHEISADGYSAGSGTYLGRIYASFGLRNVADGVRGGAAGYPKLSPEYLVRRDPGLIVLADGQTAAALRTRPGFAALTGQVATLDPEVAGRWGPRVTVIVDTVARAVRAAERAAAARHAG